MKAILMAAGMGTRISSETNKPKCLLPLVDESLIVNTVKRLLKNGIEVYIVVGYKGDEIKIELEGYPITFIENPFYRVTNSIASLWFAREYLYDDDILLANADVYYTQEILDILVADSRDICMLVDTSRINEGDYFFSCQDDVIVNYGKELKLKDRTCEYVGIAKIQRTVLSTFRKQLELLVMSGEYNYWWENTLYTLKDEVSIYVKDIAGEFWGEVDTKEDYRRIVQHVENSKGENNVQR